MLIGSTQNKITKSRVAWWEMFILKCADGRERKQGIYGHWVFTTTRDPKKHLFEKYMWYGMNVETLHELQKDDEIHIKIGSKVLKTTVKKREESGIAWTYFGEHQLILPISLF